MTLHMLAFAAVLAFGTTGAAAADLPDCRIAFAGSLAQRMRPTSDAGVYLTVAGDLRNGTALAFAKDDAVLVADLSLSTTRRVVVPSDDVSLKSSWPLSFSFKFPAQSELIVTGIVTLNDGRELSVIHTRERQVIFVDEQ